MTRTYTPAFINSFHKNINPRRLTHVMLGMGENYNDYSKPQFVALLASKPYIRQAVDVLEASSSSPLIIADFGASHGLNSMYAVREFVEYLRHTEKVSQNTQILVVFNDLSTNCWIKLFQLVSQERSYFSVACGRSFYEPCLPLNSLSIGYSSTAIHWLSCKPCNIPDHCFFMFSNDRKARLDFEHQAYLDYSTFLQHRSNELHKGGVLVLAIICSGEENSSGCNLVLELLYKCAKYYLTDDELLEYTYPYYNRTFSECVNVSLFAQHSFELINSEFARIDLPLYMQLRDGLITADEFAKNTTDFMRSWAESPLEQALKSSGRRSIEEVMHIMDLFWTKYERELKGSPADPDNCMFRTFIILKRK